MNNNQKLGYILLGAGIMALGIIIGQVITPEIEAQRNSVFDEITCRSLKVVDKSGKDAIRLNANQQGNAIAIFDTEADGKKAIFLVSEYGNSRIECNATTDDLSNCSFRVSTDGSGSELKLYDKEPGGGFNSRFEVFTGPTGGNLNLSNNTLDGGIELESSSTENRVLIRDAWQDLAIGLRSNLLLGNEVLVVNGTMRTEDR